jgi:hypothetical protein
MSALSTKVKRNTGKYLVKIRYKYEKQKKCNKHEFGIDDVKINMAVDIHNISFWKK